jgi:hypothetical protein
VRAADILLPAEGTAQTRKLMPVVKTQLTTEEFAARSAQQQMIVSG